MKQRLAAWCGGCLSVHLLPQLLPHVMIPGLLMAAVGLLVWGLWQRGHRPWLWLVLSAVAGFGSTHWQLQQALEQRLPQGFDRELTLQGRVISMPRRQGDQLRFLFAVSGYDEKVAAAALTGSQTEPFPRSCLPRCRLRVDWYRSTHQPRGGELWQLTLRLRPPHGPLNHRGYDAQRQALVAGYDGVAVVRDGPARRLQAAAPWSVTALRQHLSESLQERFEPAVAAVLRALLLGDRNGLDNATWDQLIRTGTGHLIAISGLHVGLVAALGYLLGRWVFTLWPGFARRWPAPLAGVVVGAILAAAYATLAGLLLPTQRALFMLLLGVVLALSRRRGDPWLLWLWALAILLLGAPLAPLGAGLWLSFGAVAWLIYGFYQRPTRGKLRGFIKAQALVSLGLLPLSLVFFDQLSVVGPWVNLVAVPWLSVVVLPLGLMELTFTAVGIDGQGVTWLLALAVRAMLWLIRGAAEFPGAAWQHTVTAGAALTALVGVVWLLAPRGTPLRWYGAVWLLPLLVPLREVPQAGDFWLYQFDVGQGSALAIRTQHHVMLYDTGPGDGHGRDWLVPAVLPMLREWQAVPLDVLMISHRDLDHAGGAASARDQLRPQRELNSYASLAVRRCQRGQRWTWDGVTFTVLHPGPYLPYLGNDSSCVLRIRGRGGQVFLPGDLGREGEQQVLYSLQHLPEETRGLTRPGDQRRPQVLVLGHHGSRTSTSAPWLRALAPDLALVSRSRYNRFGFPHDTVVRRLQAVAVPLLDSAACGGLWLRFAAAPAAAAGRETAGDGPIVSAARWRRQWWRAPAVVNCSQQVATAAP